MSKYISTSMFTPHFHFKLLLLYLHLIVNLEQKKKKKKTFFFWRALLNPKRADGCQYNRRFFCCYNIAVQRQKNIMHFIPCRLFLLLQHYSHLQYNSEEGRTSTQQRIKPKFRWSQKMTVVTFTFGY